MVRQAGEVLARLPESRGQLPALSALLRGVVAVRRPCSRQPQAPGRRFSLDKQRFQVGAFPGLLRMWLARLQREQEDLQHLLSHEDNPLRSGLLAGRDRRPVEAAWLEL